MEGSPPFTDRADLSGVPSARPYRGRKLFELTIEHVFGARVRKDGAAAIDLWSALAGVEWHGPDDAIVCYSFRAAGDLVA